MDDDCQDTQWTAGARETYVRRADDLVEALRAHVAANLERSGHGKELEPYMASATKLRDLAAAFDDAEFDWCGSFPLGLETDDDEDDDEWENDEDDDEEAVDFAQFLRFSGQWEFRVTDPDATIEAGRAAYLRVWPGDSPEDAEARVQDIGNAASEVLHADGVNGLLDTAGLEPLSYSTEFELHDGTMGPDETDETA